MKETDSKNYPVEHYVNKPHSDEEKEENSIMQLREIRNEINITKGKSEELERKEGAMIGELEKNGKAIIVNINPSNDRVNYVVNSNELDSKKFGFDINTRLTHN